ncbi:assimilatory sulfite reductase (NADPH) hemoprotein subunit [Vibrio gazogenes]|uniref:Sulfite reductase [NADPH] hemoprotein beta-component n=1 Tax=Vibrio gazogenes DSM 21264 = NBRC 103151 TaxID=1123492 RepID=A0A1M5EZ79_VIBGA|nr:assimilatory sulfite reductase (NADPH) hemoprotein subunit [Vibrio gazogenes]USP14759.1 assimilatory sulfite reductase (NADPH) hemoprotein subunit [Vibrio gazogenes]SHF84575.1 sulfite reductase (NADPH) hemoprotein beta-component [Vibrio gazogenes DSM 21264] [Vibrio gazogenes DSM 21264 = NBRC 103151]SJN55120.1 Sulfite reductase [NADPH] hemoprotein beta-component [Vibrio gazogenes]
MSKEKLSDNERLKSQSKHLRGTISEDLANPITGGFEGDNFQLIRFHGMYQQDDRDIRAQRQKQKLEPLHTVMLRVRLPGGIITPQQWLGIDAFASSHTEYGSIRVTNRQAVQLHGVLKHHIKPVHQLLNTLGLDSRATAGDVNRNVLCTSNPVESALHQQAYDWAKKISEHLLPKTNAYAELWLDGEKVAVAEEQETILGGSYLPRKFKTAVVIPPQNDVDVHANDLSFVAIGDNGKLIGFNVLVGGGLAMTQGDASTYPRKASEFGFITLDETLAVAEAVVATQRDWGNRSNRKNAKTKYTLDRVGVDVFKQEVEKRASVTFAAVKPYAFTARGDRIGWVEGVDGDHHLTLFIPSGRLIDTEDKPLKSGMAEIAKVHQGDFRLSPNQNVIVAGVPQDKVEVIDKIAREYGLIDQSVTEQRKASMACVSFPTCPLAMAEAERVLPDISASIDQIMLKHGLADRAFVFRITGCPNGCGRAMLAEVGLVGRAVGRYDFYIGGNVEGTRIPRLHQVNQPIEEILTTLDQYIARWATEGEPDEALGDFVIRIGLVKPVLNSTIDFHLVD